MRVACRHCQSRAGPRRRRSSQLRASPQRESGPPPPAPSSDWPSVNQLTSLWRSDVSYVGERAEADARRAQDGLAFWRGLLVAAFGRGERPALQTELKRLREELESAKQQARRSTAAPLARS